MTSNKYPRSELREMDAEERAAWHLSEGGTLTATLKIDAVPTRDDGSPGRGSECYKIPEPNP